MNGTSQLTQEEIESLQGYNKKQIEDIGIIAEMLDSHIVRLLIENVQNCRNVVITSGALASFSIAFFNTGLNKISELLIVGIIGLLIVVVFGVLYLDGEIRDGINSYLRIYKKYTKPKEEIIDTINKFEKGGINREEMARLISVINTKAKEELSIRNKELGEMGYAMTLITWLMVVSIISLINSFLSSDLIYNLINK